jgi:hypothetical protein
MREDGSKIRLAVVRVNLSVMWGEGGNGAEMAASVNSIGVFTTPLFTRREEPP